MKKKKTLFMMFMDYRTGFFIPSFFKSLGRINRGVKSYRGRRGGVPHQGEQEKARRLRQREKGMLSF